MAAFLLAFGIMAMWADALTTLWGLRRGLAESNPLMPTTTLGVLIVAGLATVALVLVAVLTWGMDPLLSGVAAGCLGIVKAYCAVRNFINTRHSFRRTQ